MTTKITKYDVKIHFVEYNKKYFGGVLKPCNYHVFKDDSFFGRYNHTIRKNGYLGHIWIAYNVDWSEEDLQDIIIHEMIHHYLHTIEGHNGGLFGHNWRFKRQCKRLKEEYNIHIHIHYRHLYHYGEKKPTNLFQKIRRFLGV